MQQNKFNKNYTDTNNPNKYDSFVFYASWKQLIDSVPQELGYDLFYQIMLTGLGCEMTTENEMVKGIIKGTIEPNIRSAKIRYEEAKKAGAPRKNITYEAIEPYLEAGYTYQQIAHVFGVHKNTVQNRVIEHRAQLEEEALLTSQVIEED